MSLNCCWNEETKDYYEIETIGINKFRCLGCYKNIDLKAIELKIQRGEHIPSEELNLLWDSKNKEISKK